MTIFFQRFAFLLTILVLLPTVGAESQSAPLRTARALNEFLAGAPSERVPFSLVGVVTHASTGSFVLLDETGAVELLHLHEPRPRPGDRIQVTGWASVMKTFYPAIWDDHEILTLGRASVPPPVEVALRDLSPLSHNRRDISTSAVVIDAFPDEIDDHYIILLLKDGAETLPASLSRNTMTVEEARRLIGCRVSATGRYNRAIHGARRYAGPMLSVGSEADLRILDRPTADARDIPALEHTVYRSPKEIAELGLRCARGTVIASWPPDRLILRRDEGDLINARLTDGERIPAWGAHVTVTGFPETDLFRLGLARARVRADGHPGQPADEPDAAPIGSVIRFQNGNLIVRADDHGRSCRFRGILSEHDGASGIVRLTDGPRALSVDIGAAPTALEGIANGSEIELVGVCRIDADPYSLYDVLPRIRGLTVVLDPRRTVTVLSRPPFLTRGRLLTSLFLTIAVLVAIVFWNRALGRRVSRRTRELLREQLRLAAAKLKVGERTRIAVELHDSLSQNLASVACQIAVSRRTFETAPDTAREHLDSADRMLASCRTELRNCLFDLRQDTLDEQNMATAIRRTLATVCGNATLAVRFEIPRSRLHETTAHAILCIVRELTSNAVRHGGATDVRVAGAIDRDLIKFSVRDNGCGFDPTTRLRSAEGHFGLDGIRDRARRFAGTLEIDSVPGRGTRVTVTFRLPGCGAAGTSSGKPS